MAYFYIGGDRDQLLLMPVSMRDWLDEGHLAWFVIDAVAQMDLSAFYGPYREDGWGRAAYEPSMMVALLLYAYCRGERSSRRIERHCQEDVAFRVIAGNQVPDHTTIARFRQAHDRAMGACFTEVLRLCARAGLVRLGVVALDGTKIAASAALAANRTQEQIAREVARILAEADAADAAEDALFGPARRGDELPEGLADRRSRLHRLKEAKRRLEEEDAAREAAHQAHLAERARLEAKRGRRLRGRKPKPPAPRPEARANATDPDSRVMKSPDRFVQGYNAQAVVSPGQIVLAAEVTQDANDVDQLHPMIAATEQALGAAGLADPIRAVVADAGYFSEANLTGADPGGPELLIATVKDRAQREAARDRPAPRGRIPRDLSPRARMERALLTKRGQMLYRRRGELVEPVFGQAKEARGVRRFMRRGLTACQAEWQLVCATHNLLKLFRQGGLPRRVEPVGA